MEALEDIFTQFGEGNAVRLPLKGLSMNRVHVEKLRKFD